MSASAPTRIVSLCPSLTETLFALGAGDSVVGRTRYCVEPRGEVERVPQLGGTKDPRLDDVAALAPDVVLMNEEENRREDADALEARGLRVEASFPRGPRDVPRLLRELGARVDRAGPAEALACALERRLARVERIGRERAPVRFACLVWRRPWIAAGENTYMSALLTAAGGVNVFSGNSARYPRVPADELVAATPECVVLPDEPFPFAARHAAEIAGLTGLSPRAVALADGSLLSWHGSRTRRGLLEALRVLRVGARVQRGPGQDGH